MFDFSLTFSLFCSSFSFDDVTHFAFNFDLFPLWISLFSQLFFNSQINYIEWQTLFWFIVPTDQKVPEGQSPRCWEEEGFYVGKPPQMANTNLNMMENRLSKDSSKVKRLKFSWSNKFYRRNCFKMSCSLCQVNLNLHSTLKSQNLCFL